MVDRILHIAGANKFTEKGINLFQLALEESEHTLLIISFEKGTDDFGLVQSQTNTIKIRSTEKFNLDLNSYNHIVNYGLVQDKILDELKSYNGKLHHIFFGYEIYNSITWGNLLGNLNNQTFSLKNANFLSLLNLIIQTRNKSSLNPFKKKRRIKEETKIFQYFKKIDFLHMNIEQEYSQLKEFLGLNARFSFFSFYSSEDYKGIRSSNKIDHFVLLGNSATETNLHFEAINKILSQEKLIEQVICPLSYGNKKYGYLVKIIGKLFLGKKFQPITKFISFQSYHDQISQCGIFIMNHARQQGIGNIIFGLLNGSKIFLNEDSIVFKSFRRMGIKIEKLESFNKSENILEPYAPDIIENNIKLTTQYFLREKTVGSIAKTFKKKTSTIKYTFD